MKKHEIIGRFIELHEGVVEVTAAQAKRRSASLANIGFGLYRIDNPVQFKVGEIIGIDYDPPKSLSDFMRLVDEVSELPEVSELSGVLEVDQSAELPEVEKVEEVKPVKRKGKK